MKIIIMRTGREFKVEDEEAEEIMKNIENKGLIKLRSGEYINTEFLDCIIPSPILEFSVKSNDNLIFNISII